MDCEKYESAMMDELYGELDELTSAAAKRHVAGCARCAALMSGLRATRRVAQVPMVDPPANLEERILAAAREVRRVVPFRRRVAQAVSFAGGWAMRPQTAMAALFLVMIGTSVLLLRGRSARQPASMGVTITEQGSPAPEPTVAATVTSMQEQTLTAASAAPLARGGETRNAFGSGAPADALEAQIAGRAKGGHEKEEDGREGLANAPIPGGAAINLPPAPTPDLDKMASSGFSAGAAAGPPAVPAAPPARRPELSPFDTALQSYRAGRFDDATRAFDALAPSDANAALWAARSVRESKTCRNALGRFDKVAHQAAGSPPGWDALLEGALCYRAVGNFDQARIRLAELLKVDSHKDRAQAELDRLTQLQQAQGTTTAPNAAARPSPRHAAAPATTATAPPNAVMDQTQ